MAPDDSALPAQPGGDSVVDRHSLVGTGITFRDPPGLLFQVCVPAIGLLLLLSLMTMQPAFALSAVWPVCYVFVSFLRRGPTQDLVFQQDRVLFDFSGREVPYASIQGLKLNGEVEPPSAAFTKAGTLELISSDGFVFAGASVDAGKAYEFLVEQIPAGRTRRLSARMTKHLEDQLARFDHDLVYSFAARAIIGSPRSNLLRAGLTMLLAVVALFPLVLPYPVAAMVGAWYLIGGVFFSLIGFFDRSVRTRPPGMKTWIASSLVVSPMGIAVEQGELIGKMRWDEILKLECGTPRRSFQLSRGSKQSINVTIKGASFMIHDLYDRPLAVICDLMLDFWETGEADDAAAEHLAE
jgi:hypothetical protein